MGQDLVDHDAARRRQHAGVVVSRRAARRSARPPAVLLAPRAHRRSGVADRQRKSMSVGDVIPAVLQCKVMDLHADRVDQRNPLAGVVKSAGVRSCDQRRRDLGIANPEGVLIPHCDGITPRADRVIAESKLYTVGETDEVEMDIFRANVLKLDKLKIRIYEIPIAGHVFFGLCRIRRMVHNLGNSQILEHRVNGVKLSVLSTPLSIVVNASPQPGTLVQDDL